MNDIRVEKGIAMPIGRRRPVYPWGKMAVGDSFEVPCPAGNKHKPLERAVWAVKYANRNHRPKRFQAAAFGQGARIWRVE
jgi:hypothetical protein